MQENPIKYKTFQFSLEVIRYTNAFLKQKSSFCLNNFCSVYIDKSSFHILINFTKKSLKY